MYLEDIAEYFEDLKENLLMEIRDFFQIDREPFHRKKETTPLRGCKVDDDN